MLTDADVEAIRRDEFPRLDAEGIVYLDYTATALTPASLVTRHRETMLSGVFGNPHSLNRAARRSTAMVDDAREAVLTFFNVDASTHAVCFTANATAAIKLVGEAFPFAPDRGFVLSADNHNSINGCREFARRAGAPVRYIALDDELRLSDPLEVIDAVAAGLFAFPAQSNFSGVRHPLSLVDEARARGWRVLLDAASFVPTSPLDLRACPADFTAVSFYKMFGYPTGVGALIARRDALTELSRPWFAGGTVEYASVQHERHGFRSSHAAFEDGTPNYLGIGAVRDGLAFISRIGLPEMAARARELTTHVLSQLHALRHANGAPIARVYGPSGARDRGGTIAFNVLDPKGAVVPYATIETALDDVGVLVRGGCFCNPGAAEAAFRFNHEATARCLNALGSAFSVDRFAECLGPGAVVGAVRASIGVATTGHDIDRAIAAIADVAMRYAGRPCLSPTPSTRNDAA